MAFLSSQYYVSFLPGTTRAEEHKADHVVEVEVALVLWTRSKPMQPLPDGRGERDGGEVGRGGEQVRQPGETGWDRVGDAREIHLGAEL